MIRSRGKLQLEHLRPSCMTQLWSRAQTLPSRTSEILSLDILKVNNTQEWEDHVQKLHIIVIMSSQGQCCPQVMKVCLCCSIPACTHSNQQAILAADSGANSGDNLQKALAEVLEKQLSKLESRKQEQISQLLEQMSKLKSEISRLEKRNKLDRDSEARLKEEVRAHLLRIRDLEDSLHRAQSSERTKVETKIVEKEVQKPIRADPRLLEEIDQLRQENIGLKNKIHGFELTNAELNSKIQRNSKQYEKRAQNLQSDLLSAQEKLKAKIKQLQDSVQNTKYLEERISILQRPPQAQQPIIINRIISPAPQIRTVYIEKPVEKTKVVEVERVVMKLMQPDRPIVNRIMQCAPRASCRCESDSEDEKYIERGYDEDVIHQYESTIQNYKQEREKLLKAVHERDSEYRLLEKRIEVQSRLHSKLATGGNRESEVQVTVYKESQSRPPQKPAQPAVTTKSIAKVTQKK